MNRHLHILIFFIATFLLFATLNAQTNRTWIFFKQKETPKLTGNAEDNARSLGITQRALWRRGKVLPPDKLIDERDYPVSQKNIEQIRSLGVTIHSTSRWFNAVSVSATQEKLSHIYSLSTVKFLKPVTVYKSHRLIPEAVVAPFNKHLLNDYGDYGLSFRHLNNINVVATHKLNINGYGVIVGMNDNGYNSHSIHTSLKNIHKIAEYDFVQRDSSTQLAQGERYSQGDHGCYTLSALAGFSPKNLIGSAYGISVTLAKTEIDSIEIRKEEDLFVEALEWHERLGADIVTASLGYFDFDGTTEDYTYSQMDGETAITTRGARIATQKGVLIVNAMGNEGNYRTGTLTGTLTAPADADSIVAVGATYSDGLLAEFSSTGPSSDGRIKPEVVAQGVSVRCASPYGTDNYTFVSGTSISTPLVAGVAALVLSARPELTPMQLRQALIATATQDMTDWGLYPNNFYGWGRVNALEAVLHYGPVIGNRPLVADSGNFLRITVWIKSKSSLVEDSLFLFYTGGSCGFGYERVPLHPTIMDDAYSTLLPKPPAGMKYSGYVYARDATGAMRKAPYNAPQNFFTFEPTTYNELAYFPEGDVGFAPRDFRLLQNFPNPFNPVTYIVVDSPGDGQIEITIYNILGQRVRSLYNGAVHWGYNSFPWNGKDDNGITLTAGVYFYRLKTERSVVTKKMIMLR